MAAKGSGVSTDSKIFAYSRWDAVPVLLGIAHLICVVWLFFALPKLSWGMAIAFSLLYSISISWNINSIAHNFIHNPYFRDPRLNRAFSMVESLAIGFSQIFYDLVHRLHHVGNSDRRDKDGKTIDYLSIYRHGDEDKPENVWAYTFKSYFRDDAVTIYREVERRNPADAKWGKFEVYCFIAMALTGLILNWKALVFLVPFYYLGHSLSSLNGYYRHYGGNTEEPLAWGVSTYSSLYNIIWLNNGYHAEHHYQPRMHWTKMKDLHKEIANDQEFAGTHVIKPCHALGFLDPNQPLISEYNSVVPKRRIMKKRVTVDLSGDVTEQDDTPGNNVANL